MEYKDLMDLQYINLLRITEPEINSLTLYFSRSKVSNVTEDLNMNGYILKSTRAIIPDNNYSDIIIDFDTYITYSVRNESFTSWDDYEIFDGNMAFRIYKKSRFLDFIKSSTTALEVCGDVYPPLFHYGIVCLNHIIDIASYSKPTVTEIAK